MKVVVDAVLGNVYVKYGRDWERVDLSMQEYKLLLLFAQSVAVTGQQATSWMFHDHRGPAHVQTLLSTLRGKLGQDVVVTRKNWYVTGRHVRLLRPRL
jgi:hypothetical protein